MTKSVINTIVVNTEDMTYGEYKSTINSGIGEYSPETKGKLIHHFDQVTWVTDGMFEILECNSDMSFGCVIKLIKMGYMVARRGWNREGMSIGLQKGFDKGKTACQSHVNWMNQKSAHGFTSRKAEDGEERMVPSEDLSEAQKEMDQKYVSNGPEMMCDFIFIDTQTGRLPWVASHTDLLEVDWYIVT